MNRDKREPEYPVELESQFILRMPEEPAKVLRDVLRSGENLKNRLTIQIENEMRQGEVRFDHWLMHAKIYDLPTLVESLKTIDNKSFYKSADICQIMICKDEPDPTPVEEEPPVKNKKKDPHKVDKKFLWPHGITPPTKNVRKKRFRKTLKKKYVEAPEIEKEVKRLLRADNEAISITWEVINEEDEHNLKMESVASTPVKSEKKSKADRSGKASSSNVGKPGPSNVVDIFGGALSDSDVDEDNVNVELGDIRMFESSSSKPMKEAKVKKEKPPKNPMSHSQGKKVKQSSNKNKEPAPSTSTVVKGGEQSSDDDAYYQSSDMPKDNMSLRIEHVRAELEELKQHKQRTQNEIAGLDNVALRQRFEEVLHTLNQDVMYKEMEYQGLLTLQNSDDI